MPGRHSGREDNSGNALVSYIPNNNNNNNNNNNSHDNVYGAVIMTKVIANTLLN